MKVSRRISSEIVFKEIRRDRNGLGSIVSEAASRAPLGAVITCGHTNKAYMVIDLSEASQHSCVFFQSNSHTVQAHR